mmetsp:Transcript_5427/g.16411  ORF Transcript_5427/g.16411 Transcript_5427/m.16411 type:complete len:263 (-) Transcript_5427:622-1410(-)
MRLFSSSDDERVRLGLGGSVDVEGGALGLVRCRGGDGSGLFSVDAFARVGFEGVVFVLVFVLVDGPPPAQDGDHDTAKEGDDASHDDARDGARVEATATFLAVRTAAGHSGDRGWRGRWRQGRCGRRRRTRCRWRRRRTRCRWRRRRPRNGRRRWGLRRQRGSGNGPERGWTERRRCRRDRRWREKGNRVVALVRRLEGRLGAASQVILGGLGAECGALVVQVAAIGTRVVLGELEEIVDEDGRSAEIAKCVVVPRHGAVGR